MIRLRLSMFSAALAALLAFNAQAQSLSAAAATTQETDKKVAESYNSGYAAGYGVGLANGRSEGYANGYTAGKREGDQAGYLRGYRAAATQYDLSGYLRGYAAAAIPADLGGYKRGYKKGSIAGDLVGYQRGYNKGATAADLTGYQRGYAKGEAAGYSSGYAFGNTAGYSEGYAKGDAAGYERGHTDGYAAGHSDGLLEGESKCVSNPSDCGITATMALPAAAFGETEPNDHIIAADPLVLSAPFWGQSYGAEDTDWFYLETVRANQTLTLNFAVPGTDASGWLLNVRDAAGNLFAAIDTAAATTTVGDDGEISYNVTLGLAGTYYLQVTSTITPVSPNPYTLAAMLQDSPLDTGNFQIGFYDAEVEFNDWPSAANPLATGVTMYGLINLTFDNPLCQCR